MQTRVYDKGIVIVNAYIQYWSPIRGWLTANGTLATRSQIVEADDRQKVAVLASHRIVALKIAMAKIAKSELKGERNLSSRLPKIALALAGIAFCLARAQGPPGDGISLPTADRLEAPGWWPTKGDLPRSQYSGDAICARCHSRIAALQESTPMYHASVRAAQSEILINHGLLQFKEGGFSTSVTTSPKGVAFTVNDGASAVSSPAVWAMGFKKGQTYVLEKDGAYFESRLSFFTTIHSLDITPGQSHELPEDAENALGRKIGVDEAERCFSCHTTAAVTSKVFDSEKATPGVTCEACHGPGAAHVVSMTGHDLEQATAIMNPADLSPSDSVDFCGACHSTWADVVETNRKIGLAEIRFEPYGLEQSRCWGTSGDARITCMACHDPHRPLDRDPSAYDSKCLACHGLHERPRGAHTAKTVCKVATSNCVTCHMPKYELPEMHSVFTDHDIRVVSASALDPGKSSP